MSNNDDTIDRESVLAAWRTTVEVQQHFNDLCMRIRNIAITVMGAFLAAAAYAARDSVEIYLFNRDLSATSVLLVLALVPWLAFFIMDRHWYHRLLLGAVIHAQMIEDRYAEKMPEIALSNSIRKSSPSAIFGIKFDSSRKLNCFYLLIALLMMWGAYVTVDSAKRGADAVEAAETDQCVEAPNMM